MKRCASIVALPSLLMAVIGLACAATLVAGENLLQVNSGESFFIASPPCLAKQIPDLEIVVPMPKLIDEGSDLEVLCHLHTSVNGEDRKGVKFTYRAWAAIHRNEGVLQFDRIDLPLKKGRTRGNGEAEWVVKVTIPEDVFDEDPQVISIWGTAVLRGTKRVGEAFLGCGLGADKITE